MQSRSLHVLPTDARFGTAEASDPHRLEGGHYDRNVWKIARLAGHLPNNIAARNGSLLHRVGHLRGGEGSLTHETDAPCGGGLHVRFESS